MRSVIVPTVPRNMPALMSPKYQTKLRYTDTIVLAPSVLSVAVNHVYSANGMYDPDVTGVGHQPRGFDQLMSMYGTYVVNKAVMRIDILDPGVSGTTNGAIVGICEDVNSGTVTDPQDLLEKSHVRYMAYPTSAATNRMYFTSYPNRRLGLNNPGNLQLSQKGTGSTNPVEQTHFKIFGYIPTSGTLHNVTVQVSIDYYATFSEIRQPVKS